MGLFQNLNVSTLPLVFILLFYGPLQAQVDRESDLFLSLKSKDSLLFEQGFNSCDIKVFEELISSDFEFYHDKSGITSSKEDFLESVRMGICKPGTSKSPRILLPESLEVFPLYDNGVLYAALQKGIHMFGNTTARFTHLWIREANGWKVSRVLSYDHVEE